MINVLGKKRVYTLFLLVGLNIALIASVYLYLAPQKLDQERALRIQRGQIATTQSDIDQLRSEFEKLEAQKAQFEVLKKQGFFSNQNRRTAEMVFENVQKQSGVIAAVADVKPGIFVQNESAQKARHAILSSNITVNISALDDLSIYKYLSLLKRSFPGDLSIKKINLTRGVDISAEVLRSIADGKNPALVQADIAFVWRTMVPLPEDAQGDIL